MILRGEVHLVDLGRPVGHEPAFQRPGVVVSSNVLNNGPGGLIVVVPAASTDYGLRSHIELDPRTSGLDHTSFARCDQTRVVAHERLSTRLGMLDIESMDEIDRALRFVLDL